MALAFEFAAQVRKVVDFAVVGDPNAAVLVRHRHVSVGCEVEDRQPPASQTEIRTVWRAMVPHPAVIRAAMRLDGRHARQSFTIAPIRQTANSAHALAPGREVPRATSAHCLGRASVRRSSLWCETSGLPGTRSRSTRAFDPETRDKTNIGKQTAPPENRVI